MYANDYEGESREGWITSSSTPVVVHRWGGTPACIEIRDALYEVLVLVLPYSSNAFIIIHKFFHLTESRQLATFD